MIRKAKKKVIELLGGGFARPKIDKWSVFIVAISLIGIYVLLPQLKLLHGTMAVLKDANIYWVLAGLAMTVIFFLASGYTQYVSGNSIGSFKRLTILQLTGAFVDHFLPFTAGSVSLTARYYHKRLGMPRDEAMTIALIPVVVGIVSTVALVALISPVTLEHSFHHALSSPSVQIVLLVTALLCACAVLFLPPLRLRLTYVINKLLHGVTGIALWPQMTQILVGCVILRMVGGLALAFAVYAVHASITVFDGFTLFVTAQIVANLSPTPGGLGSTEAFLVIGLSSVGVPLPQAVAATLVFRFVTFWVPIIPGMIAVHAAYRWE